MVELFMVARKVAHGVSVLPRDSHPAAGSEILLRGRSSGRPCRRTVATRCLCCVLRVERDFRCPIHPVAVNLHSSCPSPLALDVQHSSLSVGTVRPSAFHSHSPSHACRSVTLDVPHRRCFSCFLHGRRLKLPVRRSSRRGAMAVFAIAFHPTPQNQVALLVFPARRDVSQPLLTSPLGSRSSGCAHAGTSTFEARQRGVAFTLLSGEHYTVFHLRLLVTSTLPWRDAVPQGTVGTRRSHRPVSRNLA